VGVGKHPRLKSREYLSCFVSTPILDDKDQKHGSFDHHYQSNAEIYENVSTKMRITHTSGLAGSHSAPRLEKRQRTGCYEATKETIRTSMLAPARQTMTRAQNQVLTT